MIIDNYDIEILEKWEMEGKPEGYELEKRANDIADAEIDKKFNRFNPFYYWLICNSYIMALIGSVAFLILDLIMWIFRNVIFLIFIFVTDYLIKKETWISLLKIIISVVIIGIIVSLCVLLFGAVGGGTVGVIAIGIFLRFLRII